MKKNNNSRMFGTLGAQRKRDRSSKAGQPPGFLAPSERPEADKAKVLIMEFSADHFEQHEIVDPEELRKINLSDDTVRWINIFGVRDVALLKVLGEILGIHPLALEDISTTDQRPRVEDYGNNMHIVLKGLKVEADGLIGSEQLSIVLNQFLVVTFQEASVGSGDDVLDPIREKLRKGFGIIRTCQEDYIAYRIVDAVIDNYFVLLEGVGDEIDRIQDVVLDHPEGDFLSEMHQKRRNIIYLKRSLWPLRSVILGMKHSEGSLFTPATQVFLRDAGEHVEQVIDIVETMSESLSSALETFLMGNGNRMNETMRVLTVLSAFFIPLTFIVGIYGMNFKHMPELGWRYGYPGVWFIMCMVTLGLLVFFRRRRRL